jgi:hypothetical protein
MANVFIDILAEFTGKKAFKEAETSTDKLTKSVKKLGGALGLAFGTQQIVNYGKRAVKAFADSELEATRLRVAVTNLGLAFAAPEIDRYIDKVELATGVNRDQLQPALLTLLQTTGSLTKSQELLNLALDVSAATGVDASSVAEKLSQAYLGNTKGLKSLNLGLTTAELNSADFETIQKRIAALFAGQAQAAADSYTGQINKLAIASEQASEIIGGGLVDSLLILSGNTDVSALADDMLTAAYNAAEFTRSVTELATAINAPIKGLADIVARFVKATDPFVDLIIEGDPSGFFNKKPQSGANAPRAAFNGKPFYADAQKNADALAKAESDAKKRAAELLAIKKKQQAAEAKTLRDKKLALLIDKANIALGKSSEVFDLDKIQIAAALTNQAEQLGKATTSSQLLQITNDTARLNVKRSILALEDAIASKDEAAIIAATNKLNADNKILGSLILQDLKMKDIKTILESLNPKDLINLGNLDAAIAKMIELNKLQGSKTGTTPTAAEKAAAAAAVAGATDGAPVYTIPKGTKDFTTANPDIFNLINGVIRFTSDSVSQQFVDAVNDVTDLPSAVRGANYQARAEQEYAAFLSQITMSGIAGQSLTSGMAQGLPLSNALSGSRYAAQAAASYGAGATIVVNTGVGDPNAIAEAIDNVLREARDRGTLTVG